MRKLVLVASAFILTQLTGCVAHRHYSAAPVRSYNNSYPAQYPNQYQSDYAYQQQQSYQNQYQAPYQDTYQNNYPQNPTEIAQIVGIRNIAQTTHNNGGGAVVGAILGGIIGNQIGRSDEHTYSRGYGRHREYRRSSGSDGGRAVATLGGAIIGGVIGNEIDRSSTEQRVSTEITLRLANGQTQAVLLDNPGQFRIGDRVKVSYQSGRWVIL